MERFYEGNTIKEFEMKILAMGECDTFLPMQFTEMEDKLRVSYRVEGYRVMTEADIDNPCQLLNILEKTVLKIKRGENHFILCERYGISTENIYVNENMTDIKIMFVPEKTKKDFPEKISTFLKEVMGRTEDLRKKEYVEMIANKAKILNLSKQTLINYIGELKREAYICGWE